MKYTKGEWKAEDRTTRSELGYKVESIMISANGRTVAEVGCWRDRENPESDAQLIASAPLMHGQLKTGTEVLAKVQDIVVEVARNCPPEIAELMVVAQSYLCGVVAGNEIALAKAEGK